MLGPGDIPVKGPETSTLRFGLGRPIQPQLDEAKAHLEAKQAKIERLLTPNQLNGGVPGRKPNLRRRLLRKDLQMLDAKNVGASYPTIAPILEPNTGVPVSKAKMPNVFNQAKNQRHLLLRQTTNSDPNKGP